MKYEEPVVDVTEYFNSSICGICDKLKDEVLRKLSLEMLRLSLHNEADPAALLLQCLGAVSKANFHF